MLYRLKDVTAMLDKPVQDKEKKPDCSKPARPGTSGADARKAVQQQIIECLNRFYAIETGMWGKPINALILRTIIQGRFQDLPYDISSLSESLGLPLTTTHRKVRELIAEGYLEEAQYGKSIRLLPTEKTEVAMDLSFDEMLATIQRLYKGI